MVLYEMQQAVLRATGHENSSRHSLADVARHLMDAERIIAKQTRCLVNFPGDVASMPTQVNGAVADDTALVVDDEKYFKPDQKIDIITITGSSPNEVITRKASAVSIASIDRDTNTLSLGSSITCADNDYVGWANDIGIIDMAIDEREYLTPISALEIVRVDVKYSSSGEYRPLTRSDRLHVRRSRRVPWNYSETGWPREWYPVGLSRFGVSPASSSAVTGGIRVEYVRSPLPLIDPQDAPEIDDFYHDGLVAYATSKIYASEGEIESAMDSRATFGSYMSEADVAVGGNPRLRMGRGGS